MLFSAYCLPSAGINWDVSSLVMTRLGNFPDDPSGLVLVM